MVVRRRFVVLMSGQRSRLGHGVQGVKNFFGNFSAHQMGRGRSARSRRNFFPWLCSVSRRLLSIGSGTCSTRCSRVRTGDPTATAAPDKSGCQNLCSCRQTKRPRCNW
jgi:hypothetical protein